jgi:hypothetical protein
LKIEGLEIVWSLGFGSWDFADPIGLACFADRYSITMSRLTALIKA